jgi:hypothetical protein
MRRGIRSADAQKTTMKLKANEHNITFPFFSPLKAIKKRLELKRLWLNSQNKSKAIAPLPLEVFFRK